MSLFSRLNKLIHLFSRSESVHIVPPTKHRVKKSLLNANAVETLSRLGKAGYEAYLVGGSVRDILLGKTPKDFDIATNATPEQVAAVFRNSRLIGRRFRLAHVFYGREILEVSTFRASAEPGEEGDQKVNQNIYGTLEEDAWRRDFTINALYYRLEDESIVDYTGGMHDIKKPRLQMIGDPKKRYHEDPVRLLRAIRMAAKLDLKIEKDTYNQLMACPDLLNNVVPVRLFDEVGKLFFTGHATSSYRWLKSTGYFEWLFPEAAAVLAKNSDPRFQKLVQLGMEETDRRFNQSLSLSPGYLLAVLFWPIVLSKQEAIYAETKRFGASIHQAIRYTLSHTKEPLRIPKRYLEMLQSVWAMNFRLQTIPEDPARIERLLEQRYIRAAVDFLELQQSAGYDNKKVVAWWRNQLPEKRPSRRREFNRHRPSSGPERAPGRRFRPRPSDRHES